jgi:hypothetical protein
MQYGLDESDGRLKFRINGIYTGRDVAPLRLYK